MAGTISIYANANLTTINNEAGAAFNMQPGARFYSNGNSNTRFSNAGTLAQSGGTGSSEIGFDFGGPGNVQLTSGTLVIDSGSLQFGSSGALAMAPSASLTLNGNADLTGVTQNSYQFTPNGSVLFDGSGTAASPQLLEVMGQDLGLVAAGFQNNFAYGTLALGNSTHVQLTDTTQNVPAAGSKPDALYVNYLAVPGGSTLDLHGLNLYARQAQISGSIVGGTVKQFPTGGPLAFNSPAPGLISFPNQIDTWSFYGQAGQTVAVVVNTGSAGLLNPLDPDLNYAQVQVKDPNGHIVASGTNTQAGNDVTLSGITLAAYGTYQVQVQAPSSQSVRHGQLPRVGMGRECPCEGPGDQ